MKEIAYIVPAGQHDPCRTLGDGWGPRTVYTDGTYEMGDMGIDNQIGHMKEQIEELKKLVEKLTGAKP